MRVSYALLMATATLLASTDAATAAVGQTKLSPGTDVALSVNTAPMATPDKRLLRSRKEYDDLDSGDDFDDLDDYEIDAVEEERGKPLFGASVFDKALKTQKKMDKYIDRLMKNNVDKAQLARELGLNPNTMDAWSHKYRNIYLQLAKRLD
ncbi:hypothetical protein PHYBOEH_009727 [Phytophthora boehmeriae]|uniref:RxLR effector protein n=1 Tax=Phytophthora boehmeriae TaxID=109152 RepID=A0A8T1VVF2_9STRA|nr:hypothetical protein PHYBOEH_009727 [Phytophthora boehmeriae]